MLQALCLQLQLEQCLAALACTIWSSQDMLELHVRQLCLQGVLSLARVSLCEWLAMLASQGWQPLHPKHMVMLMHLLPAAGQRGCALSTGSSYAYVRVAWAM